MLSEIPRIAEPGSSNVFQRITLKPSTRMTTRAPTATTALFMSTRLMFTSRATMCSTGPVGSADARMRYLLMRVQTMLVRRIRCVVSISSVPAGAMM